MGAVLKVLATMIDQKKIPQVFAALAATIGAFSLGAVMGWASPALPFLTGCNDKNSLYNPNTNDCTLSRSFNGEETSWILSFFGIGALLSAIIAGILMSKIGRKWTLIALNVPLIIGWICLLIPAYKTNIDTPYLFYIGRILTSFGVGGFATVGPVYISEVVETSIRGSLVTSALGIQNAVPWGT